MSRKSALKCAGLIALTTPVVVWLFALLGVAPIVGVFGGLISLAILFYARTRSRWWQNGRQLANTTDSNVEAAKSPLPRRRYFTWLTVCLGLTGLLMLPGAAVTMVMVTLGLGVVPLFAVLAVAVVLLSLLPTVLLWDVKRLRWLGITLSVVLPGLIISPPVYLGKKQAVGYLAAAPQSPARALTPPPSSVEVVRSLSPNPDLRDHVFQRDLCDDTCQSLLFGGDVDWVRIRLTDDAFGNTKTNTTAIFALARGPQCQALYPPMPDTAPCVVFRDDNMGEAELVVRISENQWRNSWGSGDFGYVTPAGKRELHATFGPGEDAPIAFLRTQLFAEYPSPFFFFDLSLSGPRGGLKRETFRIKGPAQDLGAELAALGIALGEPNTRTPPAGRQKRWTVPPDAWQTALVASLFETSPQGDDGRNQWGNAKTGYVNNWLAAARNLDVIAAYDRRLLCRAKTDGRMRSISWLDQIERKHGSLNCP